MREGDSVRDRSLNKSETLQGAAGLSRKGDPFTSEVCRRLTSHGDFSYIFHLGQNSLQATYDVLQGVTYNVFRPLTIAGQPAVVYAPFEDNTTCNIDVGLAHDQGLNLAISGDGQADWCAKAVTAATDIVHNLGGT